MTRRQFRKIGGWSLAGGAIASVVAAVYFLYLAPKAKLEADTATWRSAARQYEADSLNLGTVKKRLQAIADTTLALSAK